jgi:glycerol-3-phosphate cytidylyltransferase-like family protein
MKLFKDFVNEGKEILPRDDNAPKVSLFLGRMAPLHIGHLAIIKEMGDNPIILLVKGKDSSNDKKKNPFDAKTQTKWIKMVAPHAEVREISSGFLPKIAAELRYEGKELTAVFAGEDRLASYEKQFKRMTLEPEFEYNIDFKLTKRIASATDVRQAIIDDDYNAYKKLMPSKLHSEYKLMQTLMTDK